MRRFDFVVVAMLVALCTVRRAEAQPTLSLGGSLFPAGPDFATDTLGDAWDFNNLDDLSPFPDDHLGWDRSTQARTSGRGVFIGGNGRFVGTTDTSAGNKVSLLFRGGADLVNTGRTGAFDHMAIPTARYGKLAIKMRLTNPGPPPNQLFGIWYHRSLGSPDDGTNAGMVLFGNPTNGWAIYIVDLQTRQFVAADGSLQTGSLASPVGGTPAAWNGSALARGFELRPQGSAGYSVPVEVDWVRLTTRDGQGGVANMTVGYTNCSSNYTLRISDAENVPFAVARGSAAGSGSFTFNYGILAPGSYTATLTCGNGTSGGVAFTINAPPVVTVLDPDPSGGADFAADVLGNPWDMADPADVPLLNGVINPGIVSDAGAPALQGTGTSTGDPQVTLLNGGAAIINTRRYRKLTFTLTLDTPFGLDGNRGEGSLARVLWGSQSGQDASSMTTTNDLLLWPGRNTYTVDLGNLSTGNGGIETDCGPCPAVPWLTNSVRFFRLDPHESTLGVTFRLAQVTLAATDEVALGQAFPVRFRFEDGDTGGTYSAQVFLDADRDPSSGLQLMGTLNSVAPATTVTFPMTATGITADREYYVYVRITETRGGVTEARGNYSGGALRVFAPSSTLPRLTVASPATGSGQPTPFAITGCAYDEGNASGINVDEVLVLATAGPGVTGPQAGSTQVLGFGGTLGTRSFPIACPTASGAFANSGFSISGIYGLAAGNWTLRVLSRSTISGLFTTAEVPVSVISAAGAPQNFQATASGNTVTVSFTAPVNGPPAGSYYVEGSWNPEFAPAAFGVHVPSPGTYSGTLASGTYYLRVVSLEPIGARIAATPALRVNVGAVASAPPGPPTLVLAQAAANPVTLSWAPGSGGAPASYTVHAGTRPGGSDLAIVPMALATSISAAAPTGVDIYVRVVAANASGAATSNEVRFRVEPSAVPAAPVLLPASVSPGRVVALSWQPGTGGGAAAAYTVLARSPGSSTVLASLQIASTSVSVPASPGTYAVTVTATNAAGTSTESNPITVIVQ